MSVKYKWYSIGDGYFRLEDTAGYILRQRDDHGWRLRSSNGKVTEFPMMGVALAMQLSSEEIYNENNR